MRSGKDRNGGGGSPPAPLVQRGDRPPQADRGDCEADCIILLGCLTGCGSTAWPSGHRTGSTAWPSGHRTSSTGGQRRYSANPSVSVRRQLPLHKGGPVAGRPYCLCLGSLCLPGQREYDSPGTGLAQRGSAVWERRLSAGSPLAKQMFVCYNSHNAQTFVRTFSHKGGLFCGQAPETPHPHRRRQIRCGLHLQRHPGPEHPRRNGLLRRPGHLPFLFRRWPVHLPAESASQQ